ncbi:MAG: 3-hydroxyacyl-ACP dehydratase FabZ [Waddliaceae bacterium]
MPTLNQNQVLDVKEIINILPHRYPFLLVDKILEVDLEKGTILGQKNLTMNEPFFQGHFPDSPIMPGVLILEALAQTGGILVHLKGREKIAVLLSVRQAKFRNPAHPGDVLYLRGEGLHLSSKGGRIKAIATVNEKVAAEAEVGFALVDKSQI